jgi:hypothetical protein
VCRERDANSEGRPQWRSVRDRRPGIGWPNQAMDSIGSSWIARRASPCAGGSSTRRSAGRFAAG